VLDFWKKQFELIERSFKAEVFSVYQDDGNLVLIMNVSVEFDNQPLFWRWVNHYRVVEGRVSKAGYMKVINTPQILYSLNQN